MTTNEGMYFTEVVTIASNKEANDDDDDDDVKLHRVLFCCLNCYGTNTGTVASRLQYKISIKESDFIHKMNASSVLIFERKEF